jgi:chemotaxis protein MotD
MSAMPSVAIEKSPVMPRVKALEAKPQRHADNRFAVLLGKQTPPPEVAAAETSDKPARPDEEPSISDADRSTDPAAAPAPLPVPHFLLSLHEVAPQPLSARTMASAEPSAMADRPVIGLAEPLPDGEKPGKAPRLLPDGAVAATDFTGPASPAGPRRQEVPPAGASVAEEPVGDMDEDTVAALPAAPPADSRARRATDPAPDGEYAGGSSAAIAPPPRLKVLATDERAERPFRRDDSPPETSEAVAPAGAATDKAAAANLASTPALPAQQLAEKLVPAVAHAQAVLRVLAEAGATQPAVKSLQLGLHPEDLGRLRVTLRLSGDSLDLRVETETQDAAASLDRDRALLGSLLQEAGVTTPVGQIDVRVGRFEAAPPAARHEAPGQSAMGASGGGAQNFAGHQPGTPAERSAAGPAVAEQRSMQDVQVNRDPSRPRASRGIYL